MEEKKDMSEEREKIKKNMSEEKKRDKSKNNCLRRKKE